ncbi:hypothetical protein BD311DRAFT_791997 [Dichomitus squalens]|uniref:Uncharacterized protein n=1 Tax=Dichomitus squalens TaxID=114155 RepID=A0A4Q9M787_9APHY|nr:hypothetical protein BD311DRAFT_791997 [Dichomitus squalens]
MRSAALHCRWTEVYVCDRAGQCTSKAGPFLHSRMSLDSQFTTSPRVDHALAVEQAARWVTELYRHFAQGVTALEHFTLPADSLRGYDEGLRSLLECAGALEQHLCGMRLFLPDEVSRSVVAIIVTLDHQAALLDSRVPSPSIGARAVIDEEQLDSMAVYLDRVIERITLVHDWMMPEKYAMLQEAAKNAFAAMHHRLASGPPSGIRSGRVGRNALPLPRITVPYPRWDQFSDWPSFKLAAFLRKLSPDLFPDIPDSAIEAANNLHPMPPPSDTSQPSNTGPSSSTGAGSRHQGASRRQRDADGPERRHSFASDTTCVDEFTLGFPSRPAAKPYRSPKEPIQASSFKHTCEQGEGAPLRVGTKRRRSSATALPHVESSSRAPKRPRREVHVSSYGTHDSAALPVALTDDAGPSTSLLLPSRNDASSPPMSRGSPFTPSPKQSPHSRSPRGSEDLPPLSSATTNPQPSTHDHFLSLPTTSPRLLLPEPSERWRVEDVDGKSVIDDLAADVEEVIQAVRTPLPIPPPPSSLSNKAKGKRRCFDSLIHTFKHVIRRP